MKNVLLKYYHRRYVLPQLMNQPIWKNNGNSFPPRTRKLFQTHREELFTAEAQFKNRFVHWKRRAAAMHIYREIATDITKSLIKEVSSLPNIGDAKANCFLFLDSKNTHQYVSFFNPARKATPYQGQLHVVYAYLKTSLLRLDENPESLLMFTAPQNALKRRQRGSILNTTWSNTDPAQKPARKSLFTKSDILTLREWRSSWKGLVS